MLFASGGYVKALVFVLTLMFGSQVVWADGVAPVGVQGEFLKIDTRDQDLAIKYIIKEKGPVIDKVLDHPENYNPTVLYALAWQLFRQGHHKTALFWNYAAQLRAHSDAAKSGDDTSAGFIPKIDQRLGRHIAKYAHDHRQQAEEAVTKVLAWDQQTPRNYDPRWIALQGVDAFYKKQVAFADKSQWEQIDAETRAGFADMIEKQLSSPAPFAQ